MRWCTLRMRHEHEGDNDLLRAGMNGIIETHSGLAVNVFEPGPEMIDIGDIAWALSQICRFNGHASRFYSVAEHSVRGSLHCSFENALWFLMHDAAEAYVGDVPTPLKNGAYREVEERVLRVIAEKYGLSWPMPVEVHEVDARMLATEARALMRSGGESWASLAEPYEKFQTVYGEQEAVTWEGQFLDLFHGNTGGRWRDGERLKGAGHV